MSSYIMSLKAEEVDFEATWSRIECVLHNILSGQSVSKLDWQQRFSDVYKICVAKPEPLAYKLYHQVKNHLDAYVRNLCQLVSAADSQNLLSTYHHHWTVYKTGIGYLDQLFWYLNVQHIRKNKHSDYIEPASECGINDEPMLEIRELGLSTWRCNLIQPIKQQLVDLLIEAIKSDRLGLSTNETIIKGVIHSLADVEAYKKKYFLELYQELFENPFIKSSGEWYGVKAEQLLSELNCSEYMKKVLQIIDSENLRCTKFIHESSIAKVITEIRARMVADHSSFLYSESESMVKSDSWSDLKAMYKLLKPIEGGLKVLISQVQAHITTVGLEAIAQISNNDYQPTLFVESVIKVNKKHSDLIAQTFNGDQLFVGALDKACSTVINHRTHPQQPCRSPELLAKYCDSLLRKSISSGNNGVAGGKALTESEIEDRLGLSIIVFKYIDDKDVFQKFYSKNMAKRLIHSQSASMEAEEIMINKLKQVCGYEFTAKLHRMFTDIGVSNGLKDAFNDGLREKNIDLGINFSIYVLQAGSWPLGQSSVPSFSLPKILERSVKQFEDFYYSKFNGRVLTWLHHLCTAEIRLCYTNKRSYLVSMQTYHMAILLLFETSDTLTYKQILDSTKLTDEQLSKHLQGLTDAKILIIDQGPITTTSLSSEKQIAYDEHEAAEQPQDDSQLKQQQPQSSSSNIDEIETSNTTVNINDISNRPETKISLNLNFSSKRPKFKIMAVPQRETSLFQQMKATSESEQTHISIDEDRKLYIQAAIVRVMKSRKVAKHNQLIQEVIEIAKSHFTPSVAMIKKCIEILIDKQYLERNTSAADEYNYVA